MGGLVLALEASFISSGDQQVWTCRIDYQHLMTVWVSLKRLPFAPR
jgi:hypothetical protein